MMELYSNRTIYLLIACCLILVLGSCAMTGTEQDPNEASTEPQPSLPCSTLSTKDLELQAQDLLDSGDVTNAREQLNCVLELNPKSSKAALLLEQLDVDPVKYLGKKYFMYTVKSSDTLSKLADQYLGSSLKFVILARYNNIDVPASLVAERNIKIPGTKPVSEAPPKSSEVTETAIPESKEIRAQALESEQKGELETAFELISKALAENPELENGQNDLARIKKGLITQFEEEAYSLELSGDPKKASSIWQRILEVDPGNIPAQLALKRLSE